MSERAANGRGAARTRFEDQSAWNPTEGAIADDDAMIVKWTANFTPGVIISRVGVRRDATGRAIAVLEQREVERVGRRMAQSAA
jgi:hypothetical protein